jgi:hypothetical protein
MSIESKLGLWFLNFINKDQPKQVKFNTITDIDKQKYERLLRLREIAQKEHNHAKFYQANRLLSEITHRLNNRFHNCNQFNFN